MPTAVITGANGGIGNAWAKILVDEGYKVYAVDVVLGDAIKCLDCQALQLDVTSQASIQNFKDQLGDETVDTLLNVAGVMLGIDQDSLEHVNLAVLEKTFRVNTYGPLLLTQALLPNVLKSSQPQLGFVSSRVGSIADNSSGGAYAYRSSKTALNMLAKNLAVELKPKNVIVSLLHPGFTKTHLEPSAWTNPESVEPEEAAGKLWKIMKSKGLEDTGKFWHREGFELPW